MDEPLKRFLSLESESNPGWLYLFELEDSAELKMIMLKNPREFADVTSRIGPPFKTGHWEGTGKAGESLRPIKGGWSD